MSQLSPTASSVVAGQGAGPSGGPSGQRAEGPGQWARPTTRLRSLSHPQLGALLLAVAALAIVVGLATHANVQAGSSSPSKGGLGLVFDVIVAAVVFVVFIGGFTLVWSLMPERMHGRAPFQEVIGRRPKKPWKERILATLISAALVGGVFAALELTHSLHYTHHTLPTLNFGFGNAAKKLAAQAHQQNSQSVNWGLAAAAGGGAAGLILLGGGALFLFRRSRQSDELEQTGTLAATSLEAVEVGIDELQAEPDPRRAVIRAYAGMEGSLSGRGVRRRPAEAPFEYLGRVLVEGGAPRPAATHLTELFERARFSQHVIGGPLKAEALDALVDIREGIKAAGPQAAMAAPAGPAPAGAGP